MTIGRAAGPPRNSQGRRRTPGCRESVVCRARVRGAVPGPRCRGTTTSKSWPALAARTSSSMGWRGEKALDQFSAFVGDTDVAGPCRPCTLPAHQSGSVESVTRTDRGAYGDADHLDCQALVIHRNTPVMHVAPTSRVNLRRGARAVS